MTDSEEHQTSTMTVAQLKAIVAEWPEIDDVTGEPNQVWVQYDQRWSRPAIGVLPLNRADMYIKVEELSE